jgi:hypothetical protein
MYILRFLAFSNLLISLVAASLSYGFTSHLKVETPLLYALVVFGATLFTYNLHRILRGRETQSDYSIRHRWLIQHPVFLYSLAGIGLTLGISVYVLSFIAVESLLVLGIVGLISVAYALKLKADSTSLREFPYLKIYLIGVSWTLVCLVWPLFQEHLLITSYWKVITAGFLFVFSATIPFDIRDSIYDPPEQKTIPHLVGVKWSKIIAVASLLISYILLTSYSLQALENPFFWMGYAGMLLLVVFTKQRNPELYFSLLIDGWIVFWGLGMYVL